MSEGFSTTPAAFEDAGTEPIGGSALSETAALSFAVPAPPLPRRESVAAEVPADESDTLVERLATFVGPNCDAYLDYYRDAFVSRRGGPLKHWHWVPFAFSVPWLFLRRRYGVALASAAPPLILGYFLPNGAGAALGILAVALICGTTGRYWYVRMALRKIGEIEGRRLWPVQRDEKLRGIGGISLVGAVSGSMLWGTIVYGPYFAGWMP